MPPEVDAPLLATLHSGYITQGSKVEEFEQKFGEYINNPYVVSVNSCTSALTLAMRLAGVGFDDEVITTPMTCSATNLPILSLGARPVFADVDPITGLIDPKSVKRLVTSATKAIVCCDWGGTPCDLDELQKLAEYYDIKLIEDAAHAIGAEYKGRKVGSIADFTCFSLQAIKHITTGDGGILACRKEDDYNQAKLLRWFGINRDSNAKDTRINEDIEDWGYKFHMNDVNATIGIEQMNHVKHIVGAHRANALFYNRSMPPEIKTPPTNDGSYWLYTLVFPNKVVRDKFKEFMADNDVPVSQVHKRNDDYSVFKEFKKRPLEGVTAFSNTMACIPVHWALTAEDLTKIVKLCNNFIDQYRGWL
jgi:dTDP-4-amino-4,6-dideoxygalactose transaminase